jgi:hypothetical protein
VTLSYTYDGADLGYLIPPTKLNLPNRAELGSIDIGGVSPEDPAASLAMAGWRPFHVDESACSQPRLFTGWVFDRNVGRSFEQTQFVGPDERIHDTTITGINSALGMRIIWDADGKRGEETMDVRMAWLLSSAYLSGLVVDTAHVLTGLSLMMDAADYRNGYPDAVLNDLSGRGASLLNYFCFWCPIHSAIALFYNYMGAATFDCTISISNAGDDNGTTIFEPDYAARLNRTPETVWSDVIVEYANGSVHVYNSLTEGAFIRRGTTLSKPYTGKSSTAIAQGKSFLDAHSSEVDRITCTLTVPASVVGLIQAGMRMPVKFTHIDGQPDNPDMYRDGTTMRIVSCTPTPTDDHASHYTVALELVAPKVMPTYPIYAVMETHRAYFWSCDSPPVWGDGSNMAGWEKEDYSIVPIGDPTARTGPVDLVPWATADASCHFQGFQVTADATLNFDLAAAYSGVSFGPKDVWVEIRQNGTIIGSYHDVVTDGGLANITLTGVAAVAGDIFTVSCYAPGWALFAFGTVPYVWTQTHFKISGVGGAGGGGGGDITPTLGTTVVGETPTPTPTGTTVTFTLASAYLPGSLQVSVDGLPIPASEVTETDPAAGTFTLSWAVDADEHVTVTYRVG